LLYSLAAAGADYEADEGQIIFEPNQASATISIMIYNDNFPELDESVFIRLTSAYLFQEGGSGGNGEQIYVVEYNVSVIVLFLQLLA